MRILLAHADRWTRLTLSETLAAHGFQITEASNGSTALRLAVQSRPDLIVLGQHLAELPAADLIQALRSEPTMSRTGIFVLDEQTSRSRAVEPTGKALSR
jgi:DNA-binding response OmpR family regulator